MSLRSPAEDEMEAAHHPNAISRRSGVPCPSLRASRYSGNRNGMPCSRVAIFRDRVAREYDAAEHTRVTAVGPLSLHSLYNPNFLESVS